MSSEAVLHCAIIGSGNIGTDLMMKIHQVSKTLRLTALVGIDPASEGLARARSLAIEAIDNGIEGLIQHPRFDQISVVFDATSAGAHARHNALLQAEGKTVIDLTPAAIGPFVIPCVNGDAHLGATNINMVTCGGQATIPVVAAVSRVANVEYAEIVASIASLSAGPGTRANIDEFTDTTSRALETVGGAKRGKAIIILNPADPPLLMRDTVYCLASGADDEDIARSVHAVIAEVQAYVPGYRLKQAIQFEKIGANRPLHIPEMGGSFTGTKVTIFLEVEGAGHYLPRFAGNLDIMTSAAMQMAERLAASRSSRPLS